MEISWGLIIFALVFKVANGLQRFSEQPKYTEVNPGQDALLVCKVIDKRGSCSWQKDNKPVGIYPKKYEWANGGSASSLGIQSSHINGDCSLWVRTATLDFDDGFWECQVTASDFTTQDALTSQPVRLVVRVAPQRPRLEHEGTHVPPGHNVTVDSGAVATVKCVSHYGNPPAILKWFLGDQEISALHPQTNATEPDNPKTWSAASVVQIPANKERHGSNLKCLAFHESYSARSLGVEARLDIRYAPSIKLLGAPQIDLEEGKDSLVLRCEADANPPASIVWRRAGRSEIASLQENLQLRPVSRRDSGLYTCQAQNSVGTSDALSVQLDIKYPPRILSAGPDRLTTAPLFSPAAFECVAEGNPTPTFKWVQRISSQTNAYLERGRESRLVIDNVTYDYQGEYECRATNFINGQERTVTSDSISLQVVGAPLVIRPNPSGYTVSVKKGESASLSLVVCADPRPRHVAWEWGSLRLEAGAGIGRFKVDDVSQDSREDCYLATLHITQADVQDSRPYYLVVENERGHDRHSITLKVEEPLELSYLLGIAVGCLAALFILMCWCIYAVRAKKCCFKSRSNYKTAEKDSEKADLKSRSDSQIGVPHLDSIYTTPTGGFHHQHPHHPNGIQGSPEAMKSTQNAHYASLNRNFPTQHDADLVLSALRHQRDLFSGAGPGSLGIPDVNTHVGSVIHAFEAMAMQRKLQETGEKPSDSSKSNSTNSSKKSKKEPFHKITLPSTTTTGTLTDPIKPVVPHRKPKAPPVPSHSSSTQTNSATTQTSALNSGDNSNNENESSNLDSLNLDDDYRKSAFTSEKVVNKPSDNINRNYKVFPPLIQPRKQSKIPMKAQKPSNTSLNPNPNSRDSNKARNYSRTDVYLNKSNISYTEDDIEKDFLRGSTVSQSFIKNVHVKQTPSRRLSTYEQNFLMSENEKPSNLKRDRLSMTRNTRDRRSRSATTTANLEPDELNLRYKEYNSSSNLNNLRGSSRSQNNFQPRTLDRAEI